MISFEDSVEILTVSSFVLVNSLTLDVEEENSIDGSLSLSVIVRVWVVVPKVAFVGPAQVMTMVSSTSSNSSSTIVTLNVVDVSPIAMVADPEVNV